MSVPPSHTPEPPPQPSGCATALLILIGFVMLLPGVCALILVGIDPKEMTRDPNWALLTLLLLAIGAGGIALIWHAAGQRR